MTDLRSGAPAWFKHTFARVVSLADRRRLMCATPGEYVLRGFEQYRECKELE